MLGAIADDFTGATDLAMTLVARGFRTVVSIGVPGHERISALAAPDGQTGAGADAVVIALKTRTIEPSAAVAASRNALRGLRQMGATRVYDKYCSTFDSTPRGNIGPVLDALAADLETTITVVVPAFPDAGRTVVDGQLFVHGTPLAESPMRHHPLTPMTDSDVPRLLSAQSTAAVSLIPLETVRAGVTAVRAALEAAGAGPGARAGSAAGSGSGAGAGLRAFVVDAETEHDLAVIAEATADLPLVTGGSGLALGFSGPGTPPVMLPTRPGPRAVLAGSASSATRGQIAHARSRMPHRRLDIDALRADFAGTVAGLVSWARDQWLVDDEKPVLVYAVGDLADVQPATDPGEVPAADLVEQALSQLASDFADAGCRELIVAGGETSGAVVSALGVRELVIGQPVAPGVTWASGDSRGRVMNLLLKSGNFGAEDLMSGAWTVLA
ncbi:four-carbon acid sugar kinase family protein [Kineosporia sp. J2-2]|uniref:3-oxo-tetronate kinase n=1 Tax=Kineosporia corallincola TaxID=2835133 RepID=A0ABS5TDB4_9ACTN|nr:3-oxo-tetronate kinase [Kineosporia corallincola]MBT0768833.1 four-carbon acid sugar kinase family protein [Kineosporia corallincola]